MGLLSGFAPHKQSILFSETRYNGNPSSASYYRQINPGVLSSQTPKVLHNTSCHNNHPEGGDVNMPHFSPPDASAPNFDHAKPACSS